MAISIPPLVSITLPTGWIAIGDSHVSLAAIPPVVVSSQRLKASIRRVSDSEDGVSPGYRAKGECIEQMRMHQGQRLLW